MGREVVTHDRRCDRWTEAEEDYALDTWAGVIPLSTVAGEPMPDERLSDGIELSPAARAWAGRRRNGAQSR